MASAAGPHGVGSFSFSAADTTILCERACSSPHSIYTSTSVTCAPYVALFQVTPRPSQRRSGSDRPIKHLAVFLAAGRFNIQTTAVKAVASADDCICCCLRGVSVSVILFPLSLRFVPCFARNAAVVHRPSREPHALIFSKPRNKAKEYTM